VAHRKPVHIILPPHSVISRRTLQLVHIAATLALILAAGCAHVQPPADPQRAPLVDSQITSLPGGGIGFIPNEGQLDPDTRFSTPLLGGHVALGRTTITFLPPTPRPQTLGKPPTTSEHPTIPVVLRFLGPAGPTAIEPVEQLTTVINDLRGDDPGRWRSQLPTFSTVVYRDLYPGIDASFEREPDSLKGTFVVAPGVNPGAIRWRYEGDVITALDPSTGDLIVRAQGAATDDPPLLVDRAPVAWQEIGGATVAVPATYALAPGGDIAFALGGYDPALHLFIDPSITYGTYLGGSMTDGLVGVAITAQNQVVVAGHTRSANFPVRNALDGTISTPGCGDYYFCNDLFISKFSPDGQQLLFSTFLGGDSDDSLGDLALGQDGRVYLTGSTGSSNFPLVNPIQLQRRPFSDAFVTRLSADGTEIEYSTYLGGSDVDLALSVAVNAAHEAVVAGQTRSGDFPRLDAFQPSNAGYEDGFITKLSADGTQLRFSTFLGGENTDFTGAVAVDAAGDIYVTGRTQSNSFPTVNPFQQFCGVSFNPPTRCRDAFVTKLRGDGSALIYSTYLGGADGDEGHSIDVDAGGHAVVGGGTASTDFPLMRPLQPSGGGYDNSDAFVAKFTPEGQGLVFSTYLGGSAIEIPGDLALDAGGTIYLTGSTRSFDFPTVRPLQSRLGLGTYSPFQDDLFVTRMDSDGQRLLMSTYLGGSRWETGGAIAVDAQGSIAVGGNTISPDIPFVRPLQPTQGSPYDSDGFVVRIASGVYPEAFTWAEAGPNPDGFVQPGEQITIAGSAMNESRLVAEGVDGRLAIDSGTATINAGSTSYPALNPYTSAPQASPFAMTISQSQLCGQDVVVRASTTSTIGAFTGKPLRIPVGRPVGLTSVFTSTAVAPGFVSSGWDNDVPLVISGAGRVGDVDVIVSVDNYYARELTMALISPRGTMVELSSGNGGSGSHYRDTIFDDAALTAVTAGTAPFVGRFRPEQALAALNGEPIAGTWRLRVFPTPFGQQTFVNGFALALRARAYDCPTGEADLSLTHAIDTPIVAGQPFTSTIVAYNAGSGAASDAVVTVGLPQDATLIAATGPDWECAGQAAQVRCSRSRAPFGASPPITLIMSVPRAGAMTATAQVQASELDRDPNNNSTTLNASALPYFDLAAEQTVTPPVIRAGEPVTITMRVTRSADLSGEGGAVFTGTLSITPTLVSAEVPWDCAVNLGAITCQADELPAGTSSIIVTGQAPTDLSSFTSAASVTGPWEFNLANNRSDLVIPVRALADLSIDSSSLPTEVEQGAVFSYTLTASNTGPSTARQVIVSGEWGVGIEPVQLPGSCQSAGQTYTCTIDTLGPGSSVPLALNARAVGPATQVLHAVSIGAVAEDPGGDDNRSERLVRIAVTNWRVYLPLVSRTRTPLAASPSS
jgi:subtilisin-like proprotein convertase family protein